MIKDTQNLAETIVHDVFDELTDTPGFMAWQDGLAPEKQEALKAALVESTRDNIERQTAVDTCQKS